jgi:glycerol uptake facilitator-like aquaporin
VAVTQDEPSRYGAAASSEFLLTTVLLFLAVSEARWLRDPVSPLYVGDLRIALALIGAITAATLAGLILTPLGRRSGGHMNPAVTLALWRMRVVPGRLVVPYAAAQLAGSLVGTALSRLTWGHSAALPTVAYGAIRPAVGWSELAVFIAEVGGMAFVMVVVGRFPTRYLAYVIGVSVGLVIAVLGPRSGASINPARQLGPALMSGSTKDLAIYLAAPLLGSLVGAAIHNRIEGVRGRLVLRPSA